VFFSFCYWKGSLLIMKTGFRISDLYMDLELYFSFIGELWSVLSVQYVYFQISFPYLLYNIQDFPWERLVGVIMDSRQRKEYRNNIRSRAKCRHHRVIAKNRFWGESEPEQYLETKRWPPGRQTKLLLRVSRCFFHNVTFKSNYMRRTYTIKGCPLWTYLFTEH
jgi:hypothetical protein